MTIMKTIYTIIILIFSICSSSAQSSVFPGTWHSQNGNTLFIVSLWQDGVDIKGHYKMVEYNNGVVSDVIYKSNKVYEGGFSFPFMISTNNDGSNESSGFVNDNTIINQSSNYKTGNLFIKLTQPVIIGCTNCNIQATWKVTELKGLKLSTDQQFNIPTDIILTKVSNTINLD